MRQFLEGEVGSSGGSKNKQRGTRADQENERNVKDANITPNFYLGRMRYLFYY